MSQEFGISLAGQSVLGPLMKMSSEAIIIWSLTRTEGSVPGQLTYMVGKLVFAVGRGSQFLSMGASPQVAWVSSWHGDWLPPKAGNLRE